MPHRLRGARDLAARCCATTACRRTAPYWHERVGYNYRITNLQAAIGESQLWRINDTLRRNARVAALYREALKGIPDVRFPRTMSDEYEPVVWLACVQVPADKRLADHACGP